jgi:hypothetical protein
MHLAVLPQIFKPGQDSAVLVQTAATIGGLYMSIPNDDGENEAKIEAVE